jgi:hypothetical protein
MPLSHGYLVLISIHTGSRLVFDPLDSLIALISARTRLIKEVYICETTVSVKISLPSHNIRTFTCLNIFVTKPDHEFSGDTPRIQTPLPSRYLVKSATLSIQAETPTPRLRNAYPKGIMKTGPPFVSLCHVHRCSHIYSSQTLEAIIFCTTFQINIMTRRPVPADQVQQHEPSAACSGMEGPERDCYGSNPALPLELWQRLPGRLLSRQPRWHFPPAYRPFEQQALSWGRSRGKALKAFCKDS